MNVTVMLWTCVAKRYSYIFGETNRQIAIGCVFAGQEFEWSDFYSDLLSTLHLCHTNKNICKQFDDKLFVVADFCTADGGNSMYIMNEIRKIIQTDNGREVLFIFEDQPCNDYNALLKNINREETVDETKPERKNMYTAVTDTNMYQQCLPSNFVHFIFSSFGFHWLSARRYTVESGLHFCDGNAYERQTFVEQAAKDWDMILTTRGTELKPGGVMYFIQLVADEKGNYGSLKFHQLMSEVHNEMLKERHVTKEEFKDMVLNTYHRTEQEIRRSFTQGTHVQKLGLALTRFHLREWTAEKYPDNGDPDASRDWAIRVTQITKSWSYETLVKSLRHRHEDEKTEIMDVYYKKMQERLVVFKNDLSYTIADIVITKHRDIPEIS